MTDGSPRHDLSQRDLSHADGQWAGLRVLVAGLGVSGFAAADALLERGCHVIVVDGQEPPDGSAMGERARILDILGAELRTGTGQGDAVPTDTIDLVVTSPGWPPHQPLLADAAAHGIPIWGEVELAWRLRPQHGAAPWLTITGTNGKTTTVQMLTSMLRAAGLRAPGIGLSQRCSRPCRLARLLRRLSRGQGQGVRQHSGGLRLQRARSSDRAARA